MRKRYSTVGAILLVGLLGSCGFSGTKQFTITGELQVMQYDIPEQAFFLVDSDLTDPTTSNSNDVLIPNREETIDWSTATVVVTHQTTKEDGTLETIELAAERFVEGNVTLEGEFTGIMEVDISIYVVDNEELSISAVIAPNRENLQFALVDYRTPDLWPPDELVLVGSSRKSKDSTKTFSVKGNLGDINRDLSRFTSFLTTKASVWITDYVDGQPTRRILGEVKLQNESFLIEADIEEPRAATILVQGGDGISSSVDFIVEPNSHAQVFWHDSTDRLLATSDSSRHKRLVESWQQTEQYLKTVSAYTEALEAYMTEWKTLEAAAEGGEDAKAVDALQDFYRRETHEYTEIQQKLTEIRTSSLKDIARLSSDHLDILLVMEMRAFSPRDENRSEAFRIYDDLAVALDNDIVSRRVAPLRAELVWFINAEESDRKLVPGQIVPELTLTNLDGTDVSLYDILASNKLVLVEFWASWCGPCVAVLPELKRQHADYNNRGFEIVSVSIDDNVDDWTDSSSEHNLPWINLGELEGWDGAVATAYGVQYIPKNFLVDNEGRIVEKDLAPHLLQGRLEEILDDKNGSNKIESDSAPSEGNSDGR